MCMKMIAKWCNIDVLKNAHSGPWGDRSLHHSLKPANGVVHISMIDVVCF